MIATVLDVDGYGLYDLKLPPDDPAELSTASGQGPDEGRVHSMFDRIAGRYDRMNTVMSAGLHRRWRERASDLALLDRGASALDVCCGTGDFALALKRRVGDRGRVVATDFSEPMLEIAKKKSRTSAADIEVVQANTMDLPFECDSFDAVTVGFGLRNLADLDRGIKEIARVLKPGGRLVCLEITMPQKPPLKWFYSLWFDRIVPRMGRLTGNSDAYEYLPRSVRRFPGPEELAERMRSAGLDRVRYELLGGGIVAIHHGVLAQK